MTTRRAARTGLFVDVSNVYVSVKHSSGKDARVNFERLLEHARAQGELTLAAAFCSYMGNGDNRFLVRLKFLGYDVWYRQAKQMTNGEIKANADMEMAFSIGQAVAERRLEKVILVTGDFDFHPIVTALAYRGVEISVIGPDQSTAWEMIVAASHFSYLSQLDLIDEVPEPARIVRSAPLAAPVAADAEPLPPLACVGEGHAPFAHNGRHTQETPR
jgi:uncharacterized LabA/DUF88 family protein